MVSDRVIQTPVKWKRGEHMIMIGQRKMYVDGFDSTTNKRLKAIENAGYEMEVIWEHEWNQLKREREDVKEFVSKLNIVTRLEPRVAFLGGRTNAVQLYRSVKEEEGEKIRYKDYTSLYPWVSKNCLSCGSSSHHHTT